MDNLIRMVGNGSLKEISFPSFLITLFRASEKGELRVKGRGKEVTIFIENGFIVHATSNDIKDRIEGILIEKGRISEDTISEIGREKDKSLIKILMEKEALWPRELKELFRSQTLNCTYQIFDWDDGEFVFSKGNYKPVPFPLKIPIIDAVIEGIRNMKNINLISRSFSPADVLYFEGELNYQLEPYELHVLSLIDGRKSVEQICKESELSEIETIRVLYLLYSLGFVKKRIEKKEIPPPEEFKKIADRYNQCFSFIYRSLYKEIGPIAENILEKYISDVKENLPESFKTVSLKKDGSLNLEQIIPKVSFGIEEFVQKLDEFLIAMIYAVKRTLGQRYESYIVKRINEIRK
jgi:hypothetical protein